MTANAVPAAVVVGARTATARACGSRKDAEAHTYMREALSRAQVEPTASTSS